MKRENRWRIWKESEGKKEKEKVCGVHHRLLAKIRESWYHLNMIFIINGQWDVSFRIFRLLGNYILCGIWRWLIFRTRKRGKWTTAKRVLAVEVKCIALSKYVHSPAMYHAHLICDFTKNLDRVVRNA